VCHDQKLNRAVDDARPSNVIAQDFRTQSAVDNDLFITHVDDCGVTGAGLVSFVGQSP
jgi:hypothetical protein